MPIEFRCKQCGRLLRTPDDAAGKQAQCPQCGGLSNVPPDTRGEPFAPPINPSDPFGGRPREVPGTDPTSLPPLGGDNPYQSPTLSFEPLSRSDGSTRQAAESVMGPAIGIIVAASLSILASLLVLASMVAAKDEMRDPEQILGWWIIVGSLILPFALCVLQIMGAVNMLRLRSHTFAVAGAVLALLPCNFCFVLTIPFGIWALVVLSDAGVRGVFRG